MILSNSAFEVETRDEGEQFRNEVVPGCEAVEDVVEGEPFAATIDDEAGAVFD